MENTFLYKDKKYSFVRYPVTNQNSLKAWNSADEHILQHLDSLDVRQNTIAIYNDRFGFLSTILERFHPTTIINYASQKKAILRNLEENEVSEDNVDFADPFSNLGKKRNIVVVKIPKSMDLFRLQLIQISRTLEKESIVLSGFMTKYFTPQMLSIASEFFEEVEQSKAWKKSRVLKLRNPKPFNEKDIINSIPFENKLFRQYFGVFSGRHIDDASQFFIKNWKIPGNPKRVLDLASGNGFLGKMIRLKRPEIELHLLDDDWLAVESSKLNFEKDDKNTFFHFNDSLDLFDDEMFDLIVCNPPFHFEHETNIEVAIDLFKQAKRCLSENGSFQIVSNRHLNYATHLRRLFEKVEILKRNKKFEIIICRNSAE